MSESFSEKVARRQREREAAEAAVAPTAPPPEIEFDPELIPDLGPAKAYEPTQEDLDIDVLLRGVSVVDAYIKWCGKSEPKRTRSGESIMVSCPNPDHPDKNPSAWMNEHKGVFSCGGCSFAGGDKFDIAAWHFGYPVPDYKNGASFPALRREMAESLGYSVTRSVGGQTLVTRPAEDEEDAPSEPEPAPLAAVVPIAPAEPTVFDASIDWRTIVPHDTFLHRWMKVCTTDDLPDEYYFWLGMMALGFAAGDDALMVDNPLVKPNLLICLLGPTGIGKSRSMQALEEVLIKALPYEHDDPFSTGIRIVAQPGSAEALLDYFSKPEYDPTDPKKIVGYRQIRGWLKIDELADLMGKASRQGSVLKPLLMRLYDSYGDIDQTSRGSGYVKAAKPFCSVVTTTQPKAVRNLLMQTDADSGFVNRWIFAAGMPKKLVARGRQPLDIDSVVPLLSKLRTWCSGGRRIPFDDAGGAAWDNFFEEYIEPLKLEGDSSLLTRVDLTFKKIMLLFAINEQKAEVDAPIVERALALWPYLRETYESLAREIGVGEFEECRLQVKEFIIEWTFRTGTGPSGRDISRKFPKQFSRKLVLAVMVNLEQMGEIVPEKKPGAGALVRYSCAG